MAMVPFSIRAAGAVCAAILLVSCTQSAERVSPLFPRDHPINSHALWPEQLLAQAAEFRLLAREGRAAGDFDLYLDQFIKVRDAYRRGDHVGTAHAINAVMAMLENRVGGVDADFADRLWDECYRRTPSHYLQRARHVRALGNEELARREERLRLQHERASLSSLD